MNPLEGITLTQGTTLTIAGSLLFEGKSGPWIIEGKRENTKICVLLHAWFALWKGQRARSLDVPGGYGVELSNASPFLLTYNTHRIATLENQEKGGFGLTLVTVKFQEALYALRGQKIIVVIDAQKPSTAQFKITPALPPKVRRVIPIYGGDAHP